LLHVLSRTDDAQLFSVSCYALARLAGSEQTAGLLVEAGALQVLYKPALHIKLSKRLTIMLLMPVVRCSRNCFQRFLDCRLQMTSNPPRKGCVVTCKSSSFYVLVSQFSYVNSKTSRLGSRLARLPASIYTFIACLARHPVALEQLAHRGLLDAAMTRFFLRTRSSIFNTFSILCRN
jgi:hypothetical protein